MSDQHYLCRLPFNSGDGATRLCLSGEMTTDSSVDFKVAIESSNGAIKLPFCIDCFGEIASGELVYGAGALKCMQCGSVFLLAAG